MKDYKQWLKYKRKDLEIFHTLDQLRVTGRELAAEVEMLAKAVEPPKPQPCCYPNRNFCERHGAGVNDD